MVSLHARAHLGIVKDAGGASGLGHELAADQIVDHLWKQALHRHLLILRREAAVHRGDVGGKNLLAVDGRDDALTCDRRLCVYDSIRHPGERRRRKRGDNPHRSPQSGSNASL